MRLLGSGIAPAPPRQRSTPATLETRAADDSCLIRPAARGGVEASTFSFPHKGRHFGVGNLADGVVPRIPDDALECGPQGAAKNRKGIAVGVAECRCGKTKRNHSGDCVLQPWQAAPEKV